eukprot:scaffold8450_cov215-Amphora_coffeaeformis.AAC.8
MVKCPRGRQRVAVPWWSAVRGGVYTRDSPFYASLNSTVVNGAYKSWIKSSRVKGASKRERLRAPTDPSSTPTTHTITSTPVHV